MTTIGPDGGRDESGPRRGVPATTFLCLVMPLAALVGCPVAGQKTIGEECGATGVGAPDFSVPDDARTSVSAAILANGPEEREEHRDRVERHLSALERAVAERDFCAYGETLGVVEILLLKCIHPRANDIEGNLAQWQDWWIANREVELREGLFDALVSPDRVCYAGWSDHVFPILEAGIEQGAFTPAEMDRLARTMDEVDYPATSSTRVESLRTALVAGYRDDSAAP